MSIQMRNEQEKFAHQWANNQCPWLLILIDAGRKRALLLQGKLIFLQNLLICIIDHAVFILKERTFNKSYHMMLSAWPPSVGKNSFRCFVGCQQTMLAPDCRGNSNCSVAMIYEPSGVMQSHQKASLNVQFWQSFKEDCCLHHFLVTGEVNLWLILGLNAATAWNAAWK